MWLPEQKHSALMAEQNIWYERTKKERNSVSPKQTTGTLRAAARQRDGIGVVLHYSNHRIPSDFILSTTLNALL